MGGIGRRRGRWRVTYRGGTIGDSGDVSISLYICKISAQ